MELAAKEARAATAVEPFDRFVAGWELDIARSEKNLANVAPFKIDVSAEVSEQTERLVAERKEFERLKTDAGEYGTGGAVGKAVRRVFNTLDQRRRALEYAVKPRFEALAEKYADRRFEIDQRLYELNARWTTETKSFLDAAPLPAGEVAERTRQATALRDSFRKALQAERKELTGAINELRKLRDVQRERTQVLGEFEQFVHGKVFWIQDRPALLSGPSLTAVRKEVAVVGTWVTRIGSRDLFSTHRDAQPQSIVLFLLGALALLFIAILIRRRLQRFLLQKDGAGGTGLRHSMALGAAALVQSSLLAGACVAVGALVPVLGVDTDLSVALSRVAWVLAVFFLLRSLARTFFGDVGLAVRLSWMSSGNSEMLRRQLWLLGAGVLVFVLPASVLGAGFLEIEVLPRMLVTAFLVVLGFALYRLFCGASAAARFVVGGADGERTEKLRRAWSVLLAAAIAAVLLLDISGRRFAAQAIGLSLAKTIVAMLALAVLYRIAVRLIDRAMSEKTQTKGAEKPAGDVDSKEQDPASTSDRWRQIQRFTRVVFLLIAAWCVVSFWGLSGQFFEAMQSWHLYAAGVDPAEGTQLWVTAGDLFLAIAVLVATVWLLRHLPGIYDLAVFPRFDLDRGLRYAIVTISRYGLFFVGAMVALGALRIDFSSLGWLVAAMGIGLGFGLQEIVSNFVSGIILLVERPLRVGDLVTVGDVIGKIQRINIRATTVLNMDRQEVIVPNRALIAQNVTNWTLASKVLRLTIQIGVAYGSDVDRVREILRNVAKGDPSVLKDPPAQVFFVAHGDSSLDFEVRVFTDDPDQRFAVRDRLNGAINRALTENGIEIPFPQRDIHIRSTVDVGPDGVSLKTNSGS